MHARRSIDRDRRNVLSIATNRGRSVGSSSRVLLFFFQAEDGIRDRTVTRVQTCALPISSLLLMLASGYSPVYAAHVPPASYRTSCMGTGPFKLKEWRKGEFVEMVKNPEYFVKGRPYLDTLRYIIIAERGTRTAALQAGKVDVSFPGETTKTT